MIQVSDTLWLEIDPTGKVLLGNDYHVVRINIDEREQVINFIQNADEYLNIEVVKAEAQQEEETIYERDIS